VTRRNVYLLSCQSRPFLRSYLHRLIPISYVTYLQEFQLVHNAILYTHRLCHSRPCKVDHVSSYPSLRTKPNQRLRIAQFSLTIPGASQSVNALTLWPLKMGPIGCPETSLTTNQRCVTFQKKDDLIYTAAEAWNCANNRCLFRGAAQNTGIDASESSRNSLVKFTENRLHDLQELLLWIKKFFALEMWSQENSPKNREPTVGFSFTTMLQHTGRFLSK